MRVYRLAILNSHPVQYGAPFFRRLAKEPEVDLTIYYYSQQGADEYVDPGFGRVVRWDVPLLEGYRSKFLPNLWSGDRVGGPLSLINPSVITEIRRNRFDAVWLVGYAFLSDWLAYLAARLSGTPILCLGESSLVYDRLVRRPWYIRWLKPPLLRWFLRGVHAAMAIGSLNREFYRHYGVPEERIFPCPHAVDNAHFAAVSARYREQREALRCELGIAPEDVVFLFAAKMIPLKAPIELLEAYRRATQGESRAALLMVGEGPLRAEAEAFTRRNNLRKVVFTGFVNQSELPKYYALSDVHVRPDGIYRGDWGFTVNEAMACGLAVVASDKIGATYDLVRHGENGYVVKFGDLGDLTSALRKLAGDAEMARRMGERSREIIQGWSYEEAVRGVLGALHSLDNSDQL